jgi:hypothetical protein
MHKRVHDCVRVTAFRRGGAARRPITAEQVDRQVEYGQLSGAALCMCVRGRTPD